MVFSFFFFDEFAPKPLLIPKEILMCVCENGHHDFPSSSNWVIINSGQEHNCSNSTIISEMKDCVSFAKTVLSFLTNCVGSHICNVVQYAKSYVVCFIVKKETKFGPDSTYKNSPDTCFIMLRS